MKAWDTVVIKAESVIKSVVAGVLGAFEERTQAHPHAGRAGVVQSVTNDLTGAPVSAVVRLDETQDGKPVEIVTVQAADVNVHHVF